MNGAFGVFEGVTLLAEFGSDDDAEEFRRDLLQENLPEYVRRAPYDPGQLQIREVPEDYASFRRLLDALRSSQKECE